MWETLAGLGPFDMVACVGNPFFLGCSFAKPIPEPMIAPGYGLSLHSD